MIISITFEIKTDRWTQTYFITFHEPNYYVLLLFITHSFVILYIYLIVSIKLFEYFIKVNLATCLYGIQYYFEFEIRTNSNFWRTRLNSLLNGNQNLVDREPEARKLKRDLFSVSKCLLNNDFVCRFLLFYRHSLKPILIIYFTYKLIFLFLKVVLFVTCTICRYFM